MATRASARAAARRTIRRLPWHSRPRPRASQRVEPEVDELRPSDSICSFTRARTSYAETIAAVARAVAIARVRDTAIDHHRPRRGDRPGGGHEHRQERGRFIAASSLAL